MLLKLKPSFSQIKIDGFSRPFRFDKNRSSEGVIFYVRNDIPSKQLTKYKLPNDIEIIFIEVNLRKIKWLIFGPYHPPSQLLEYFFKHVDYALDVYGQINEKFLLPGDLKKEGQNLACLNF